VRRMGEVPTNVRNQRAALALTTALFALVACTDATTPERLSAAPTPSAARPGDLDEALRAYLASAGFTGRIGSTLEARLGRRIEPPLADLGRLLWFDPITALNDDNASAG
jgi:cytochrome c peroxidase